MTAPASPRDATRPAEPASAGVDKRIKLVEATMRRHGFRGNALIEALHTAQEAYGFLDDALLRFVARSLRLPLSKVYGVATFYNLFTLKPPGEHTCVVCLGTACYIKGARHVLEAIDHDLGLRPGATTANHKLSLLTARCFGSCAMAPVAVVDGEVSGKILPEAIVSRLRRLVEEAS